MYLHEASHTARKASRDHFFDFVPSELEVTGHVTRSRDGSLNA